MPTRAAMAPRMRMSASAAVAPPPDRLRDHSVGLAAMHEGDDNGGPNEE